MDVGYRIRAGDSGPFGKANLYGSVLALPFLDASFEVVHFKGLLHHIDEPRAAWAEIVRVSKDIIIGREPHRLNPGAHLDRYHTFHGFTYDQLMRICEHGVDSVRIAISSSFQRPWRVCWDIIAMPRPPAVPPSEATGH